MIFATFIWGAGFAGTRWTLMDYSPTWSNAMRFIIATLIISPYLLIKFKKLNIKVTATAGLLLYWGLHFQTLGIAQTSMAKSGFLTVFYAIFTPIILVVAFKETIRKSFWALLLLALLGIALLCEFSISNFNIGDFYVLISAFFFSCHILWIDKRAQKEDPINFNFWQCPFIALPAFIWAYFTEGCVSIAPLFEFQKLGQASSISGFLILSVFSSLVAFSIQISAQKKLRAHTVSLIFLLESVFAALFGYFLFNESLSAMALTGATLVIAAVALIPVLTRPKKLRLS